MERRNDIEEGRVALKITSSFFKKDSEKNMVVRVYSRELCNKIDRSKLVFRLLHRVRTTCIIRGLHLFISHRFSEMLDLRS